MGVGKRLCADPAVEDHRSLCNAAARVVGGICHRYGAAYTNLQPRITKALFEAVADSARPLSTQYGAMVAIAEVRSARRSSKDMCATASAQGFASVLIQACLGTSWGLSVSRCSFPSSEGSIIRQGIGRRPGGQEGRTFPQGQEVRWERWARRGRARRLCMLRCVYYPFIGACVYVRVPLWP